MPLPDDRGTARPSRSQISSSLPPSRLRRSRSPRPPRVDHSSSRNHRGYEHSSYTDIPLDAPKISKHDFKRFRSMFALYLEVQKQLDINELSDKEVMGRWKSFVGKWNRGELAEGWYRPQTFERAEAFVADSPRGATEAGINASETEERATNVDTSSDDDMPGPVLPGNTIPAEGRNRRSGPTIPNLQDLELQQEIATEESLENRENLRELRRLDRKQQKAQVEEIAPRAEAGTKERMLEKKREKADANRTFASGKTEAGGVADVPDSDLLGGEDDGIEGYKKQKREMERKKNERELKREEILRARQAEREQRLQQYKEKEERTMSGLIALAKARFG